MKPLYLLHDLVIPAGTAFHPAPAQVNRAGEGHVEATVGLPKDTSGSLTYFVGPPDSPEREQMVDLFSETAPAPPHQQRVIDEKAELDTRITALDKFIKSSPIFQRLPLDERVRMNQQWSIMSDLSAVLNDRIKNF